SRTLFLACRPPTDRPAIDLRFCCLPYLRGSSSPARPRLPASRTTKKRIAAYPASPLLQLGEPTGIEPVRRSLRQVADRTAARISTANAWRRATERRL